MKIEQLTICADNFLRVPKVWGEEIWLVNTDVYCAKILHVNQGGMSSLHRHPVKDETFIVTAGSLDLQIGEEVQHLKGGEVVRIPPNTWHRFKHPGDRNSITSILEISTHHEDSDVERAFPSMMLRSSGN